MKEIYIIKNETLILIEKSNTYTECTLLGWQALTLRENFVCVCYSIFFKSGEIDKNGKILSLSLTLSLTHTHTFQTLQIARKIMIEDVCVCVWERERKKGRKREGEWKWERKSMKVIKKTIIVAIIKFF